MRGDRLHAALLCAALAFLLTAAPPVSANRLTERLGDAGVTAGLGVNVHFPPGRPRDFARIRAAGFRVVRTDLLWAHTETEPGRYDWRAMDSLLREMEAHGLKPLLILAYSNPLYAPRLEGRPDAPSLSHAAPLEGPAREAFMRFAEAAASHYRGRVIWEVWNEPDHNFGHPVDLRAYLGFAAEACARMRAREPEAVVIGPAASGFLWWFLKAFLDQDAEGCFDAVSVHPYRDRAPEDVIADWVALEALARQAAHAHGRPPAALANTEWGYSSTGGEWSRERQADYVARLWLLDRMAKVPLTIVYDWWDDGPDPREKEASFGIVDHGGVPKPLHGSLSRLAAELDGLHYLGRIAAGRNSTFLLAFGDRSGEVAKIVGWEAGKAAMSVAGTPHCGPGEPGQPCHLKDIALQGAPLAVGAAPMVLVRGPDGAFRLQGAPQ
ncbi:glycoside hydrolase 5 family protein [Teichococcus oryzae]|uniref:Cellulase family glycosylhydrolase n=1 Tax=Teichococcus oryzae TaxID=1608942 RepID=A0A5B2TD89_9PROT|nr:hypothetical protein [Pseudoroseomonas oryzae]KAA2212044.1 hypothetical protein F0Q34_17165 [Pseudoroseomonas oryzae]